MPHLKDKIVGPNNSLILILSPYKMWLFHSSSGTTHVSLYTGTGAVWLIKVVIRKQNWHVLTALPPPPPPTPPKKKTKTQQNKKQILEQSRGPIFLDQLPSNVLTKTKYNNNNKSNNNNDNNNNNNNNNNGNFICVLEYTIVNLATYRQFTNAAWDWAIPVPISTTKDVICCSNSYIYHFFDYIIIIIILIII